MDPLNVLASATLAHINNEYIRHARECLWKSVCRYGDTQDRETQHNPTHILENRTQKEANPNPHPMHRSLTRKASPLSLPSNAQVGTRIRSEHCTLERTSHLLLAWHETCRSLSSWQKRRLDPRCHQWCPRATMAPV